MTLLYRAIFRVDFDQCFELADKPGTIIQTILDQSKDYWEIVGPTNNHYQINAARKLAAARNRSAENFAVDTNAISGNFEMDEGVPLDSFIGGPYLNVCNDALSAIVERFGIKNINRIGVRLFMTGGVVTDSVQNRKKVAARFKELAVPGDITANVADVALVLVGGFDHDTEFRLHCGPGADTDVAQFLQQPIAERTENTMHHKFSADIDIYQQKINFKGTNLLKWIKAKEPYIKDLLAMADKSAGGSGDNA